MGLILSDISYSYGSTKAVSDADLEVAPGEILCLFGPSGCGKTTLLRIAAGLEPLQTGEVRLDDKRLAAPGADTPPERRPIGYVFQDYVLFPHLTVEQNIAFGVKGAKQGAAAAKAQLRAMGMEGLGNRFPHELSGGQQQRTALARALARNPRALLLDEPFASIDAVLRARLRDDLRRMLKEQNVAVILVTHDPEEALALGDRIALMREGRIIETAEPSMLFEQPKTPEGALIFPGSQILSGAIEQNILKTAFGDLAAPSLPNGLGVAVIREGALKVEPDPNGAVVVLDSRYRGPGWILTISARETRVLLNAPYSTPLPIGSTLRLDIDNKGIFIYPSE